MLDSDCFAKAGWVHAQFKSTGVEVKFLVMAKVQA